MYIIAFCFYYLLQGGYFFAGVHFLVYWTGYQEISRNGNFLTFL